MAREAAQLGGREIGLLGDLPGPKLRLGDLPRELVVAAGETITLGAGGVPIGDPTLYARVRVGDPVFIADGTIALEATEVSADRLVCRVRVGGTSVFVAEGMFDVDEPPLEDPLP